MRSYVRPMRRLLFLLIAFFALAAPADAAWVWPVSGDVITPYRNGTDPYAPGQHRGIDIAAPVGAPVVAAAAGEVRFAGTAGSSGLTIGIRTADGYDTSYLHLSALDVRAGAHVSAGDRIGAVGTTGVRSAPAPHLHFGVRDAGTRHDYHDPLAFLPPEPPPARAPDPAPAPAPAPAPLPLPPVATPRPAAGPAPAPRGRPAPRAAPHPRSRPAPRAAPGPQGAPRPSSNPRGIRVPRPAAFPHRHAPARPALDPGPRQTPASPPAGHDPIAVHAGPRPAAATQANAEASGGLDVGWMAACAGLLLAAALLGLSADRRTPGSSEGKVRAALRPLTSRTPRDASRPCG